jgi:hypothetical protein
MSLSHASRLYWSVPLVCLALTACVEGQKPGTSPGEVVTDSGMESEVVTDIETATEYVCPNGAVVSDVEDCDPCYIEGDLDSDCDGLTDTQEMEVYETDPYHWDSDGDGVPDAMEIDGGTDPNDPYSYYGPDDEYGRDDGDYYASGSGSDDETDSDGEDSSDDAEEEEDAGSGAANVAVGCSSVAEVEGSSFGDDSYYDNYDGRIGPECHCSVTVDSTAGPVDVIGISVWSPTDNHAGTDWWPNHTEEEHHNVHPAGVIVTANPSDWGGLSVMTSNNDVSTGAREWFSFDGHADWERSATEISGTYDIVVSYANGLGDSIESCSYLEHSTSRPGLQLRVDVADGFIRSPAAVAPADLTSCQPGKLGKTSFELLPAGQQGHLPVATGGKKRVAGTNLKRVTVQDWRGADRLTLSMPDGRSVQLTQHTPAMVLPAGDWSLADVRIQAHRDGEGLWMPPTLEAEHHCPVAHTSVEYAGKVRSYDLSWAGLQANVRSAAGLTLASLLPSLAESAHAPFRLRLVAPGVKPEVGPAPDRLRIDVAGVGSLLSIPLEPTGLNTWDFRWHTAELIARGTVRATSHGLVLSIEEGGYGTGEARQPLQPTTVTLPLSR